MKQKIVKEDAMGGVSTPMSTLNNTPGVGNATPATSAAMSGAQQTSSDSIGSGDKWGSNGVYNQNGKLKKKIKKSKKVEEDSLNPYDKIGVLMAKKMKVPLNFRKKHSRTNTVTQKKYESFLVSDSLDNFLNESN